MTHSDLIAALLIGATIGGLRLVGAEDQMDERKAIIGKWECVACDWSGKPDPYEENRTWVISETHIEIRERARAVRMKYKIDARHTPVHIDWWDKDEKNPLMWSGIVRTEGGGVQICARLGVRGEVIERPKNFEVRRGQNDVKMCLLSKLDDE